MESGDGFFFGVDVGYFSAPLSCVDIYIYIYIYIYICVYIFIFIYVTHVY